VKVYAIAGGTGAGKSTVARRLARRYGGRRIDADRIGHAVLRTARVRRRLIDAFGPDIVAPDGGIDRRRLGARVFGRPARLRTLNRIVHPEIARRLRARLDSLERAGTRFALVDAALFFEFDLGRPVDGVLAVVAPRPVRRQRLAARGLSEPAITARLQSQPRVEAWARRADVRLDSDCDLDELGARIDAAWNELRRRRRPANGRNGT
jgi:dephospho-CoA kinase